MCAKMKINGVEKLVPNLHYKKKYVIHIKALKQAIDHGLVLEKIHRAIEFKQSAWMREYIDFNTTLRTAAKNDFEKDFYKLMNNSVFGKTMENTRKHKNIKLVNNKEEYLKNIMKPNFKSGTLLGPDLMGCEMGKVRVVMNKPVYHHIFIISQLRLTSHPRSTVVLLDTETPGTSREIYSEDAEGEARTHNPWITNPVL